MAVATCRMVEEVAVAAEVVVVVVVAEAELLQEQIRLRPTPGVRRVPGEAARAGTLWCRSRQRPSGGAGQGTWNSPSHLGCFQLQRPCGPQTA